MIRLLVMFGLMASALSVDPPVLKVPCPPS